MSRRSKGPHLWLHRRPGYAATWRIIDKGRQISTGFSEAEYREAEEALARYIAEKYNPRKSSSLNEIFIADVIKVYLEEHVPTTKRPDFLIYTAESILNWWGEKTLAEVRKTTCEQYLRWRVKQGVKESTARHDLKTLRSAINYYHKEHGPLPAVPAVTVPQAPPPRMDYWLTRKQVADRIRVARKNPQWRHIARMLLIGVYTGTRPGAMLDLRWVPSPEGGWFDLESQTLHRKGIGRRDTKKRQPPARIHARLLPHLKRWREMDMERGITHVIHFRGRPVEDVHKAWNAVAIEAGQAIQKEDGSWKVMDSPHICRHTAATWQMQSGTDIYEAAGYLGMSPETLIQVYGHHHPDFQNKAAKATGKKMTHTNH